MIDVADPRMQGVFESQQIGTTMMGSDQGSVEPANSTSERPQFLDNSDEIETGSYCLMLNTHG